MARRAVSGSQRFIVAQLFLLIVKLQTPARGCRSRRTMSKFRRISSVQKALGQACLLVESSYPRNLFAEQAQIAAGADLSTSLQVWRE
jgi:hypothetical protein